MTTTMQDYSEAINDRPSDTPWTEEEKARFAANREKTVEMAQKRAAEKYILANDVDTVEFYAEGDQMVVWWRKRGTRKAMTIEEARQVYARLLRGGFHRW